MAFVRKWAGAYQKRRLQEPWRSSGSRGNDPLPSHTLNISCDYAVSHRDELSNSQRLKLFQLAVIKSPLCWATGFAPGCSLIVLRPRPCMGRVQFFVPRKFLLNLSLVTSFFWFGDSVLICCKKEIYIYNYINTIYARHDVHFAPPPHHKLSTRHGSPYVPLSLSPLSPRSLSRSFSLPQSLLWKDPIFCARTR